MMTTANVLKRAFDEATDACERIDDAMLSEKRRSPGASISALVLAENRLRGAIAHVVAARKELNAKANEPEDDDATGKLFPDDDDKAKGKRGKEAAAGKD